MPALPVVFTRHAARQVEVASRWWSVNRTAVPTAIQDDLRAAVKLVAEQPWCGIPMASQRHSSVRRIHLVRVGYDLYYRVAPRLRQVQVLAFWHASRGLPPPL